MDTFLVDSIADRLIFEIAVLLLLKLQPGMRIKKWKMLLLLILV